VTTYVALLRGINVGGNTRIAMADLKRVFVDLGHEDARTYIQSGNVIFSARSPRPADIEDIEKAIAAELGPKVRILLRTAGELDQVIATNPFAGATFDESKVHVTFLDETPAKARVGSLRPPAGEKAEFSVVGREVFLNCPDGYGRSKLNNAFFEKQLAVAATTRGWKTILKLRDLAAG
jgi:uncharacterized protein (DUF1697 family)